MPSSVMEKILYINSSPKEHNNSRTLTITDAFINKYKSLHECTITEKKLYEENLYFYNLEKLKIRDKLEAEHNYDSDIFNLAKEFADADKIVVAAPFWDMSFPAILKAYIEHICVCGITFKCCGNNLVGMAKATKMMYIATSGGYMPSNPGADYMKSLCKFLGIDEFFQLTVGGFDVVGNDIEKLLYDGKKQAEKLAEKF